MVIINAFKGIRYNNEKVDIGNVITPPYDVISEQQIELFKSKSPYNFVNIILNKDHANAAQLLKQWKTDKVLVQDETENLYIYKQRYVDEGREYIRTGFVALIELEELGTNILPHEKTLPKALADRIDLMQYTRSNEGQVFFIYEDEKLIIDNIIESHTETTEPVYVFEDDSHVIHKFWKLEDRKLIQKITDEIGPKPVVIADGHHRYKAALEFKRLHPEIEGAKYRMATFINSFNEGLVVLPTNRLLFNMDIDFDLLLIRLHEYFLVQEVGGKDTLLELLEASKKITKKTNILGLIDNANKKYYLLQLKDVSIMDELLPSSTRVYQRLDVAVLHKLIIEKIMNISAEEQGNGNKVDFVKGNKETLAKLDDKKYQAAFLLNPPLIEEIFETAKAKEVMPQKSTYFYPKIFSGLVIYTMEEKKMANKLFIPGPVEVRKEVLDELARPQIGHRTEAFKQLFGSLKPGLRELFATKNDVLVSTSSGSGFWEACARSCINKKVLHAVNGAFSKKWADVSERCGKEVERVKFDNGKAVDPDAVDEALSKGGFEAFCMVHNETSTGVMSNLKDIALVMRKYPDVLWFVDSVSSFAGTQIGVDELGIDICLASSQKALALPAGIAVAAVSERAYKKAETVTGRGYYFDILELRKEYATDQTPYTPSIPHLYALKKQLERIKAEGVENRFKRHIEMAEYVRTWVTKNGLQMFSPEGYHSNTVACIVNTKKIDLKAIKKEMTKKGFSMDSGYGKLNEKLIAEGKADTFRIAHMGDLTLDEIKEFTAELEKFF